jgi:hypothetical protein
VVLVVPGKGLSRSLTGPLHALAYTFTGLLDALSDAFSGLFDTLPRAFAQALNALARARTDLLHALTGSLADLFDAFAHVLHGLAHAPGEVADDLRVVVDGFDQPHHDVLHGVQADFHQGVDLHVLDQQPDVLQAGVRPHRQFQQVEHLGVQADGRLEVVEVELDAPDVRVGVHEHVGPFTLGRPLLPVAG